MAEEKPKNEEKGKDVEWSFDFGNLGDSFNRLINSLAGEEELKTETVIAARGEAESAELNIDYSVGKGFLRALANGSANLLEAELHYVGEVEFIQEGTQRKYVRLKQKTDIDISRKPFQQGMRALASRDDLRWDVAVSPDIPLKLEIDGGVGPVNIDLSGLQLNSLEVDAGVGTMTITMPSQERMFESQIDGGVGQTRIYIPEGTATVMNVDGGVGEMEITVPPGAAVQLKAEGGLGSINVPASFQRRGKSGMMGGTWQTEGFDLAERRIVIYYEGGVGQLTIREVEIL